MKILVAVADIATLDDNFQIEGLEVDEQYLTHDLNEWDSYALEEAVKISEAEDDIEVVTATIGPERTEETIRQALAKWADRAVRIWDDSLAERLMLEPDVKASLLAAVAEEEEPDLILTGVQSGDDSFGATGVSLAKKLDFGWAAVVTATDLDEDGSSVAVHRELEGGLEEHSRVTLPAVLTVQTGINEPRYASLRGIRQASSKPLDVRTLDDLSIDTLDSRQRLLEMYEPESPSEAELWSGSHEDTAGALAELLDEQGVTK